MEEEQLSVRLIMKLYTYLYNEIHGLNDLDIHDC